MMWELNPFLTSFPTIVLARHHQPSKLVFKGCQHKASNPIHTIGEKTKTAGLRHMSRGGDRLSRPLGHILDVHASLSTIQQRSWAASQRKKRHFPSAQSFQILFHCPNQVDPWWSVSSTDFSMYVLPWVGPIITHVCPVCLAVERCLKQCPTTQGTQTALPLLLPRGGPQSTSNHVKHLGQSSVSSSFCTMAKISGARSLMHWADDSHWSFQKRVLDVRKFCDRFWPASNWWLKGKPDLLPYMQITHAGNDYALIGAANAIVGCGPVPCNAIFIGGIGLTRDPMIPVKATRSRYT
jgi:hypothetical protein